MPSYIDQPKGSAMLIMLIHAGKASSALVSYTRTHCLWQTSPYVQCIMACDGLPFGKSKLVKKIWKVERRQWIEMGKIRLRFSQKCWHAHLVQTNRVGWLQVAMGPATAGCWPALVTSGYNLWWCDGSLDSGFPINVLDCGGLPHANFYLHSLCLLLNKYKIASSRSLSILLNKIKILLHVRSKQKHN